MIPIVIRLFAIATGAVLVLAVPVAAQDIDFGDDDSPFALDGECDDMRFEGSGMTETPLLDSDIGHDASDCRSAYDQGRLRIKATQAPAGRDSSRIQWGDDNGQWANDGECDDMRFEGPGMTATPLLEADVKHDATDCRTAYEQGRLDLRGASSASSSRSSDTPARASLVPVRITGRFDWGDNSGEWANDGECDDLRFLGEGLTAVALPENIGRDERDCRAAYDAGTVGLNPLFLTPTDIDDIDFGDDAGAFSNNGLCDDLRFTGAYASSMIYLTDDLGHDASDCRAAYARGDAVWQADALPFNLGQDLDLADALNET